MKKIIATILALVMMLAMTFSLTSCIPNIFGDNTGAGDNVTDNTQDGTDNDQGSSDGSDDTDYVVDCSNGDHIDNDADEYCDLCNEYVIVVIDFYVLNDLHGKFCDTATQPGVDELGTYFKNAANSDDHVVIMSSGDMWQGTAESNLTNGHLLTEWMNEMGFVSMTLGNHEFDWGEDAIRSNKEIAEFPFLAINVYNKSTNQLADYCTPSIMIERGGIKIGIIGAIGDCYSSISSDMVEDVYFKVGKDLSALVKAESNKLREMGADFIVYSLHDGYDDSISGSSVATSTQLSGYYDIMLSSGYVDLVFEGHTHQYYSLVDAAGVYHMQAGGENYGIAHAEIKVNSANGNSKVKQSNVVTNSAYKDLADDPDTEAVEEKYADIIEMAYSVLGKVSRKYADYEIEAVVAQLYLELGLETWGDKYDIVLGGGFLKTRSPYSLSAGDKTYADVLSLLPFNNRIVLCKVSGNNLSNKFIYTTNSDYYCAYSEYGSSIKNSVSASGEYYVVVDTYTALYAPNGLTIVEYYDDGVYARDLLADAIKDGMFEIKNSDYKLTSIPEANSIGEGLGANETTTEFYYIKGTVKATPTGDYGNFYLVDENGNEIYVYGIYDLSGNKYAYMSEKPDKGDVIIVYAPIMKYQSSYTKIELKNATLIEFVK